MTINHPIQKPDAAVMAQMRQMLAPTKSGANGPMTREGYDQMIANIEAVDGVTYEPAQVSGISGWWCHPPQATPHAAILFLHGGGFVLGSAQAYRNFAAQVASRVKVAAFVPDYRLAPENPFPAGLEDGLAVYHGLVAQGFRKIALVGDSAGGGLTLALLPLLKATPPAGAAVISPCTDLALTGASLETRAEADPLFTKEAIANMFSLYLASHDPRDPKASPLYADLNGLPPITIHVGEDEILLDDSVRYAQRVESAGGTVRLHIWQGMMHVFASNVALLGAAREAMDDIGAFLRQQLA